jgi:hypothetical protein
MHTIKSSSLILNGTYGVVSVSIVSFLCKTLINSWKSMCLYSARSSYTDTVGRHLWRRKKNCNRKMKRIDEES